MNADYILTKRHTLLDALRRLEAQKGRLKTLIVVDDDQAVAGTLTDGDIRRALIGGKPLDCPLAEAMHTPFKYVAADAPDIPEQLARLKQTDAKLIPVLDDKGRLVRTIDLTCQRSMLPMDAVLMAGGKGERLRPLTTHTPKPLLKVGGKPIIDYHVHELANCGVEHLSVTTNYLSEQVEAHFAEPVDGVQVQCIHESEFFGTMGAVRLVPQVYNDTLLVMNADLFTNIDFEDFYLHFRRHEADLSVATIPYSVTVPYGILEVDGDEVAGVVEKPVYNYSANAGIYLLKKDLLEEIPSQAYFDATDLIAAIAGRKKVVRYPLAGYWIDIGTPSEYQKACDLANHIQHSSTAN